MTLNISHRCKRLAPVTELRRSDESELVRVGPSRQSECCGCRRAWREARTIARLVALEEAKRKR